MNSRSLARSCCPAPDSGADAPKVEDAGRCPAPKCRTLALPLKRRWFEAIQDGSKNEEYRLANEYWSRRLEGKTFDEVVVTLGYPARDDMARRISFPWNGFYRRVVTSEEWGNEPQEVYAIRLGTAEAGAERRPAQDNADVLAPAAEKTQPKETNV